MDELDAERVYLSADLLQAAGADVEWTGPNQVIITYRGSEAVADLGGQLWKYEEALPPGLYAEVLQRAVEAS